MSSSSRRLRLYLFYWMFSWVFRAFFLRGPQPLAQLLSQFSYLLLLPLQVLQCQSSPRHHIWGSTTHLLAAASWEDLDIHSDNNPHTCRIPECDVGYPFHHIHNIHNVCMAYEATVCTHHKPSSLGFPRLSFPRGRNLYLLNQSIEPPEGKMFLYLG